MILFREGGEPSTAVSGGQFNDQIDVIGLNFGFVGGFISADLAAFFTTVDDDISFFGIGFCFDRAKDTAAGVGTVTRIDVHVKRAKTSRTMVTGGISQGLDLQAAIFTNERIVIFGKSFLFHIDFPSLFFCFL